LLVALLGGMALFGALLLLIPVIYDLTYADKIYPGVSVAGIDMSGLTAQEAAARLVQAIDYPTRGQVAFVEGANVWVAHPNELGLYLDYPTSAQAAYDYGRTGGLFARWEAQYRAWSLGVDLPVRFLLDERTAHQYLSALAAQIDRPIIEATLSVSGIDVVVRPGQVGRSVDVEAALNELRLLLPTLTDGLIALRVNETPPIILDATAQAELARQILSAPLTITVPNAVQGDPGPWTFDQAALAAMLTIQRVDTPQGAIYQVGLNSEPMRAFLESTVPLFARAPANAQFIFNDETKQLDRTKNAVIGRALDVEATLKAINQQVVAGAHSVPMSMVYTNPALTDDATGASLGITQLVSSQTTYFYGSSASRIQNIQTASARFHGVMVPPGATFSMAEVLGEVSLDTGYAEALIIYGNRTIQGVGGGVCQVSTTLFRTVFFGGYPVVERYAHAYRVGYYEQTASGGHDPRLAGLDATVFAPVVDFKFTNDTPYWLLMETYVNVEARTLTWKFYSTSDGRTVDWYTTGPENLVEPPEPLYEENPDLAKGVIKQVDWEAQGADITVTRTVYRNGQIVASDTFTTHYVPWRAVFQYGPGTKVPTPEP
jgi:vancomycin resistance protein YoaR